jgi:hypothetical protein
VNIDLAQLTLAAFLTTAGSTAAAALVTGVVAVIQQLVPSIDGHQAQVAAILSAVLVILAAVQAVSEGAIAVGVPLIFAVLFGWYAITRLAMSIHDDVAQKPRSLVNQSSTDPGAG